MRGSNAVADDFARRVRVRLEWGAVTPESLSSTLRQFIQAFNAESGDLNRQKPTLRLKRGAQPGNENRRVHGFYARDAVRLHREVNMLARLMGLVPKRQRDRS